ncbi:hypothetical protein EFER_4180 [Escherichia fergusonii ATCC 35469]|uniref:Uncharacterized protein n=1 Tax=Escherichia fergusonii (strain ATCC 35469 / DSM 13698 / CCUG 18766 / IAM 14443 / JCM 21226 / LMG 7866 / NBRC 102419 / NCTC 12128 / CDC 0568-73) TaxID=585054 RepID=B7LL60_ESCF3|nr:hypothetical protein AB46_5040 [Escherichia coli 3-267-03_S1_C2]CAQ91601.1 hypothetical protein EFER_4180 [Escherichia fergusonii ATCC 35469]
MLQAGLQNLTLANDQGELTSLQHMHPDIWRGYALAHRNGVLPLNYVIHQ